MDTTAEPSASDSNALPFITYYVLQARGVKWRELVASKFDFCLVASVICSKTNLVVIA